MPASITVSNRDAQIFEFREIHGFNAAGVSIMKFSYVIPEMFSWVSWVYADSDVSVSGIIQDPHEGTIEKYSLVLTKGWNVVYSVYDPEPGIYYEYTTTAVPGFEWTWME